MKKTLLLIIIIIGLSSCESQKVKGIWMSYNNYTINKNIGFSSGDEGVIIDFKNQTLAYIKTDSILPVRIDYKKSKIFLKTDTLNIDFKVYGKDSIEIDFGKNMMHVFRPLNLNHKLSVTKNEIKDFLINNQFERINNSIELEFSSKLFYRDVMFDFPNKNQTVINKTWNEQGYWLIKEIQQNFFLIYTIEELSNQNIYQILSIDKHKVKLKQLQEDEYDIGEITELKTSL